jgi:hypothetical protein
MKEEMTARLEAKIEANNEKVEVPRGTLISQMDTHQAKIEARHEEWMAAVKDSQERMEALLDVSLEMTEVFLEKIEANQGKVEIKMEASLEKAMVETIRALDDRYGDQHLTIGRRQQLKKQPRTMVGPRRSWPPPADG